MDAYGRAKRQKKTAGSLIMDRRPGINPPEWWVWCSEGYAPDWYAGDGNDANDALDVQNTNVANDANVDFQAKNATLASTGATLALHTARRNVGKAVIYTDANDDKNAGK